LITCCDTEIRMGDTTDEKKETKNESEKFEWTLKDKPVDNASGKAGNEGEEGDNHDDSIISNPDPYFPPIVSLPEVQVNTGEDDEKEIFKLRARLYRYAHECDPPEWKERGTGDIKILKHKVNNTCRIVMRREKTMRLCANHSLRPYMELLKHSANEMAWVWKTYADFADEVKKPETLAVRFNTLEKAQLWKQEFDKALKFVLEKEAESYLKEKNSKVTAKGENKKAEKSVGVSDAENKENVSATTAKANSANDPTDKATVDDNSKSKEGEVKTASADETKTTDVTAKLDSLAVK